MLERYRSTVNHLPLHHQHWLREEFFLPPHDTISLFEALQEEGLDQATVVLALLHAGRHDAVQRFVQIKKCPPQLSPQRNLPLPRREHGPDDRHLVPLVKVNPLTIRSARERWDIMRRCRTVGSYALRVPRWLALRDVREWSRAGWLEVVT